MVRDLLISRSSFLHLLLFQCPRKTEQRLCKSELLLFYVEQVFLQCRGLISSLGTPQRVLIDIGSTHRPSVIGHSINPQSIARQLRATLSLPITRSVRRIIVLDDSILLVWYWYPSFPKNSSQRQNRSIAPGVRPISFKSRGPFLGLGIRVVCSIRISGVLFTSLVLILPSLQMADLPHNVPLIDESIEQPAQETRESHPSNKKTNGGADILWDQRPCHEPDSNQHLWKKSSELPDYIHSFRSMSSWSGAGAIEDGLLGFRFLAYSAAIEEGLLGFRFPGMGSLPCPGELS
ncbi:hypothetical protein ACFE04_019650 [Oxalis oulophora]